MKVTGTDGKEYTIKPEANLRDANLSGADLEYAYLDEANLMDTNLSKTNLSGAVWNDETVFPEGFEIPDELRG